MLSGVEMFSLKIIVAKIAAFLFLMVGCSVVCAQYARTVSRANCLVPTNPFLSPHSGATFNETISWDPRFWKGHYVTVVSNHYWSRWIGGNWTGYWDERVEATYSGGSVNSKTWRAWAGKVLPYNFRTVAGTKSGYRSVSGTHKEKLAGSTRISTFYTYAVDCNITRW